MKQKITTTSQLTTATVDDSDAFILPSESESYRIITPIEAKLLELEKRIAALEAKGTDKDSA